MIALLSAAMLWALPPAVAASPTERTLEASFGTTAPTFAGASGGPPPSEPWWRDLGDPALASVLDEAMGSSPTVRAAWERVTVARTGAWQQGSVLLPSAAVATGFTRNSTEPLVQQVYNSISGASPLPEDELRDQLTDQFGESYDSANWQLQGSWTVDLFGVHTTAWLASRWDAAAMDGNRAAQAMAVASSVGAAWLDLTAANERLAYVGDQVRVSRELSELVDLRYQGGEATALDLLQQRQQQANIEATLPAATAAVERTAWRLASLLGRDPTRARPADFAVPAQLPDPPAAPSLGAPADLLDRRPDLVASMASARAAGLRRASGWLSLAPTLQLSGYTGDQGQLLGADETEWDVVGNWQVGVQASVPVFNGGRKIAAARGASASARAAGFDLQQTLLNATVEVQDARRVVTQRDEELTARQTQVQAARMSFDESRIQYLGGLTPYVSVQTALNTLQMAELGLIQARRDRLAAHITLHNALGAPWALDLDRPVATATGGL